MYLLNNIVYASKPFAKLSDNDTVLLSTRIIILNEHFIFHTRVCLYSFIENVRPIVLLYVHVSDVRCICLRIGKE